ncbi:hypothetical protein CTH30272_03086 [Allocatenococcus thiocycli]|nr:hypothetical protein CTH30272_03086 [Catenococcus thiocycli]
MNHLDIRMRDEVEPEYQTDNWDEELTKAEERAAHENLEKSQPVTNTQISAETYVAEYKKLAKEGAFDAKTKAERTQEKIGEYHEIIEDLVLKRGYTVPQVAKVFKEGLKLGALTLTLDFSEQNFRTYVQKNVKKPRSKKISK